MSKLLVIIFLFLSSHALGQTDCDCKSYPWKPASCDDICWNYVVEKASSESLQEMLNLSESLASEIKEIAGRTNYIFLHQYRDDLDTEEWETLENAVTGLNKSSKQEINEFLRHNKNQD